MSKDIKEQIGEFSLWGWTAPFRSRFLLFSLLGLASVIAWQDIQARKERQFWQGEVKRLQSDVEDCLKQTAAKVEQLQAEQIEYIRQFDRRTEDAERVIRRLKSKRR